MYIDDLNKENDLKIKLNITFPSLPCTLSSMHSIDVIESE